MGVPREAEKIRLEDTIQAGRRAGEGIRESRRKLAGRLEIKLPENPFLALACLELLIFWNLIMVWIELLLAVIKVQVTAARYIWKMAIFVCRQWRVEFELAKPHWTALKIPMMLIKAQAGVLTAGWEEIKGLKPAAARDFADCGKGLRERADRLLRLGSGRIFEAREEFTVIKEMGSRQEKILISNNEKIKVGFTIIKEQLAGIKSFRELAEGAVRAQVRSLMAYGQMGDISLAEGHTQEAGEYYLRQLKEGKKLKRNAPRQEISQLVMAAGYCNMGNFCLETGQSREAEEYYQKMIGQLQEALAKFPELTDSIVTAWNNLGDAAMAGGQAARAEWYYIKGLTKAGETENNSAGLAGRSLGFDRLGDLEKARGRWEKALEYYQEALKIDQELCQKPDEDSAVMRRRTLALSWTKLGDCYLELGQENKANPCYKEASRICRQISRETGMPADWRESLRKQGEGLEQIRQKLKDMDMSFPTFRENIEEIKRIYRAEMENDAPEDRKNTVPPEEVETDLMFLYIALGKEYRKEKQPDRAGEFFQRAQELGAELCQKPQAVKVRREFSYSCDLLGLSYEQQGQKDLAEKYYLIQVETDRQLCGEEASPKALENLAFSCERLCALYKEQGRFEEAKAFGLERAGIYEQIREGQNRENSLRQLAESYKALAAVCGEAGQEEEEKIYQKKAFEYYRELCKTSEASSDQVSLGVCYANGWGVETNWGQAVFWYSQAADRGNPYGQYNLGRRYFRGEGVEKSYEEAAAWFKKAAQQGCKEAQRDLARCYKEGLGVEQDDGEAARWQERADL